MRIAVIGGGNVGGGLAGLWRGAGHEVEIVARGERMSAEEAPPGAVLLAVPAAAIAEACAPHAAALEGVTLIDATNDVAGELGSPAALVAEAAPGAHLVKAFNTVFAALYEELTEAPGGADMAYCGERPEAKEIAAQLIADAGFRPIDCGGLEAAADLEGFARMVIRTAYSVGRGPFTYRFDSPARLAQLARLSA